MTDQQVVAKLKTLKTIKPNQQWGALLLDKVVGQPKAQPVLVPVKPAFVFFGFREMAYSLASLALVLVGVLSFAQYTMPGDWFYPAEGAHTLGAAAKTNTIAQLNSNMDSLAKAAKKGSTSQMVAQIQQNASALNQALRSNTTDPSQIQQVASTLKALADVPSVKSSADVTDLYQTVVQVQINDLKKATLTDEQKKALDDVQKLYDQGKYSQALEALLLMQGQ